MRGRYDKYEPKGGGFRAALAANYAVSGTPPVVDSTQLGKILGMSIDASGNAVVGNGGTSGIVGVMVLTKAKFAGDIVDIMTDGEIVSLTDDAGAAIAAGAKIYAAVADGTLTTTATSNVFVGFTCEAGRLVVRVAR